MEKDNNKEKAPKEQNKPETSNAREPQGDVRSNKGGNKDNAQADKQEQVPAPDQGSVQPKLDDTGRPAKLNPGGLRNRNR